MLHSLLLQQLDKPISPWRSPATLAAKPRQASRGTTGIGHDHEI
jgi:hypothetical protein